MIFLTAFGYIPLGSNDDDDNDDDDYDDLDTSLSSLLMNELLLCSFIYFIYRRLRKKNNIKFLSTLFITRAFA